MILRDYQELAIERVKDALRRKRRRILLVAPTGSGKTVVAARIVRGAVSRGNKVLFVAHRGELVEQTSRKLDDIGVPHGIIMRQHHRTSADQPVQVATIQTLTRRDKPDARIIIFDEAHLSMSSSFQSVAAAYPQAVILGMTATPIRLDDKPLGALYEELVEIETVAGLIGRGFLVPIKHYAPHVPELSGIGLRGADYADEQLEALMNQKALNSRIVEHWMERAAGRPTIAFAVSIAHSRAIVAAFQAAGIPAEHIDGTMSVAQRAPVYARLRSRQTLVVSNVGVATEGWDEPCVACAILARPTKSLALYLQMAGRALRTSPGKPDCVLLDMAGCGVAHGRPDRKREWSLAPPEKRKARKGAPAPVTTVRCEKCQYVYDATETVCPECGHERETKGRDLDQLDSDMSELTREHDDRIEMLRLQKKREVSQSRTLEDLIRLGTQRGYRAPHAWARHVMAARGRRAA